MRGSVENHIVLYSIGKQYLIYIKLVYSSHLFFSSCDRTLNYLLYHQLL